jgi:hypothetical protein
VLYSGKKFVQTIASVVQVKKMVRQCLWLALVFGPAGADERILAENGAASTEKPKLAALDHGWHCPVGRYYNQTRLPYNQASTVLARWQRMLGRMSGYCMPNNATQPFNRPRTYEDAAWQKPKRCQLSHDTATLRMADFGWQISTTATTPDEINDACIGDEFVSDRYRFIYRIMAKVL